MAEDSTPQVLVIDDDPTVCTSPISVGVEVV